MEQADLKQAPWNDFTMERNHAQQRLILNEALD
jgi:hypothetical protein